MSNRILKYIFLLWIHLFVQQSYAQSDLTNVEAIRDKQRVNYVYNFTNYIDWEGLSERTEFIIGVLGVDETNLVAEFELSAKKRTIKGLPVIVKSFSHVNKISPTDILYVNNSYGFDLNPILEKLYRTHTLLVTEGYPFNMSMINFIELEGEFHFEINTEKINRAQLLVAPKLLAFSTQNTADWNQLYSRLQLEMETVKLQKEELGKLSSEIKTQKLELKAQEEELNKTIDSIQVQKELLNSQKKNIERQNADIKQQIWQLASLSKKNNDQQAANSQLKSYSKEQAKGIVEQNSQIRKQGNTLGTQLKDIKTQSEKIKKQNNELTLQLTRIQQQRILLFAFVAIGLLAILIFISLFRASKKRKQNEATLKIKNAELINVNKSLDSFSYRVSHDLKAPVTNMKNMVTLLKKFVDPSTNAILPDLFKNLDLSTNRLDSTIIGMLELTKIDRIKENKTVCNLLEIVKSLLPEYQDELDSIDATVDLSGMTQSTALGTKIELISIFQNLITNSIKYRSKNRTLSIVLETKRVNDHCLFTYSDNGMGIDLEKFENKLFSIFERFSNDNSISGTGIGMHTIKKMIDNSGGTIQLKGAPDKGLTYLITFPIYPKKK